MKNLEYNYTCFGFNIRYRQNHFVFFIYINILYICCYATSNYVFFHDNAFFINVEIVEQERGCNESKGLTSNFSNYDLTIFI